MQISTNKQRTDDYLSIFNRQKVIKSLVKTERPVIFDIGANEGQSLVEFKEWWSESQVHCFEPQEECWNKLNSKVKNQNFRDVFINKYALGEIEKEEVFYSHDITSGQSGLHKINTKSIDSINLQKLETKKSIENYKTTINHKRVIKVKPLNNYFKNHNIEHVDLMKIDTQGYEPEVLSGLKDYLSKVDVIITELMFYDFYERSLSFSDIEKFLLPAGFRLFDISHISKNPMNGRTDWVDVIYVNSRIRLDL